MMRSLCLLALLLPAQETKSWTHGPPDDPGYFPLAVWLQDTGNVGKYKDAGINTYVALWEGPTQGQFDALKASGMKLVCHQNAFGLAHKDDPTIIAWMHGDEPDNAQPKKGGGYGPPILPEKIIADYRKIREADPSRPVMLNLGQGVAWDGYVGRGVRTNHPEDYAEYMKGSDIVSFDIYPVVHDHAEVAGKLYKPAEGVERLRKWGEGKKIVWNCIEASRIDNERTKATAAQVKTEVWMSLIHGSTGIIYFVHQFKPKFVEASLLQDADLLAGVTAVNNQIRSLAPALNSPTIADGAVVTTSGPEAPVDLMVKRQGGATYVFAVAMRDRGTKAAFTVKGAAGAAEVIGENRRISVKDGAFVDDFKPYDVHLYRIR